MKKLHSFVFYALVAPAITLGAGTVLAQQSTDRSTDRQQQNTQPGQSGNQSNLKSLQGDQGNRQQTGQSGSTTGTDANTLRNQSSMQNRGHIRSVPANGNQASDLIGAKVRTAANEDIGSVSELIIDQNGQVVAIVVGTGGFLGMGKSDVAIGWDHVTISGAADKRELRVDVTGADLRNAPKYENKK
ncbi:PRC-barrel domain-containing protein [Marinospirillum alkaliphilum DSM 21637]|uniref:PRC-barrel domain-containing protein n=2 Tax=Marinospirillum TaxID=64968 RepID=A0A1K1TC16_9GAMM|nr:PRC-barrel domain-containing protein [Marinospirillum alkaliphilum DSM 21637]